VVALARPKALAVPAVPSGHTIAFESLYAAHARYVAGVVYRVMGSDPEIDDIVQETFIDAIAGLERLEDPGAVRAWLVTVAVRRTRRTLGRRRRRALFLTWIAWSSPRASDPHDRRAADELYDALARIPEDLRIPWTLHRIEQMSLPQTADACEVSLATVKRRIADAEERLTRRLGAHFEGSTP
jgi:RNA polymerase sigma-70 factor (ECF subfamily)